MRRIQPHERPLIDALFELAGLPPPPDATLVESMDDGGMGSLVFEPEGRKLGGTLCECQFTDADGVLVLVALNVDREGIPLEIDIWKVDFQPLVRWPESRELMRLFSESRSRSH